MGCIQSLRQSPGCGVQMQGQGWITWEEAGGILGGKNGDLAIRAKFLDPPGHSFRVYSNGACWWHREPPRHAGNVGRRPAGNPTREVSIAANSASSYVCSVAGKRQPVLRTDFSQKEKGEQVH